MSVAASELNKPVVESEHRLRVSQYDGCPQEPEDGMEEPARTACFGDIEQFESKNKQKQNECYRGDAERAVDKPLCRPSPRQTENILDFGALECCIGT